MGHTRILALLALAGMMLTTTANAVEGGFYLGGSVGIATTEVEDDGISFDEDDTAYKIFGGFHFLQFFAVEASYRDFGSPSTDLPMIGNTTIESSGFDISGLAGIPLGPIYLFGRVGIIDWEADAKAQGQKVSEDGTDYLAGIGLQLDIAKLRLRGEVEYFDIEDGSLMYTVGAAWIF